MTDSQNALPLAVAAGVMPLHSKLVGRLIETVRAARSGKRGDRAHLRMVCVKGATEPIAKTGGLSMVIPWMNHPIELG